jgi:DNA-binding transcriptional LysR family regulator
VELRHLRYFVAVAEMENVSRAATQRLHVAQPSLSRQIRDLEDEVGVPLLERTAKSVRLTEAGRLFLDEARAVLERADEALRVVRALAKSERGELHLGYLSHAVDPLFYRILSNYRRAMPNVEVKLHDWKVEEMVDALLAGTLPLAFIFHAPKPGALRGLRFLPLSHEQMRLAVSPTHPLATRDAISLEEAAAQPFVGLIPEQFPDFHFFRDAVFASTRNKPRVVEERDSIFGLASAVEEGIGVTLAVDRLCHVFSPRIKFLRLTPEPETVDVGLAARKGRLNPLAGKFWQTAFAEWLERIFVSRPDKGAQFLYGKVRGEVLLGYEVNDSFCLCQYGIRGA